jgi:hypothetical protein
VSSAAFFVGMLVFLLGQQVQQEVGSQKATTGNSSNRKETPRRAHQDKQIQLHAIEAN